MLSVCFFFLCALCGKNFFGFFIFLIFLSFFENFFISASDSVNNIKLLTIKAFVDNLVTHKYMEANDTVKEYIDKLENLSKETAFYWNQLSTKQMESSTELTEIRKMLKNLYASMYVISEGSDSFRITVRKSEELLSFGLSLINEVMNRIRFFNDATVNLSQKLEDLISKREEINAIVSSLQELNETSGNTARNAEIKAIFCFIPSE